MKLFCIDTDLPSNHTVGKHRHFRMIALQGKIRDMTGVAMAFDEIWKKLEEYYSLEDLDELVRICSDADCSYVSASLTYSMALAQTRHLHLRHTLPVLVLFRHYHDRRGGTVIILDLCTQKMIWIPLVEGRIMVEVRTARPVIDRARRNLLVLHRNFLREPSVRIRAKEERRKGD